MVACPPRQAHGLEGEDLRLVEGGATRARSVANALEAVDAELVAIHDAARPLVSPELIEATIASLSAHPDAAGAIAAAPVADTIKLAPDLVVGRTLDRGLLWAAQTPQVFRVEALREALAADPERIATATDEAMILEAAGGRVLIHPAPPENLKVTTPFDLRLAEMLLGERSAQ